MDDEPGFGDGAPPASPLGKPAPSTSRAVAMFAVVFAGLALIVAVTWSIGGSSTPEPTFCTGEGRIDPTTGATYVRDREQGCQWVDAGGNIVPGE